MAEVGKSFDIEEQQAINLALNEAEAMLESTSVDEIKIQLEKVESAANRITAAMLTMT